MEPASNGPALGHALLRFLLGINFFGHGIARLSGDWSGFVAGLQKGFAETWLPLPLVTAFGWFIPPFELCLGVFLILGLFQRAALVAGGLFLAALIFGSCLRQEWGTVGTQMIYALCFYLLLYRLPDDRISLDARRRFARG